MSDFGEEIIERLSENSSLKNVNNPARNVIINSVGEWLDNYVETEDMSNLFLNEAQGKYLDVHGKEYAIYRKLGESDEDYKKRIIYHLIGHLTVDYLINIYDLKLYVNIPDFDPILNHLTSDNCYINGKDGFMAFADEVIKSVLDKKFVLGSGIRWL